MAELQRHTRCEYCRQITDGVECRKCGAPLPDVGGASSVAFSRMMLGDFPEERARMVNNMVNVGLIPGSALLDYSRRNKINNIIQMIAPYKCWEQRSLVNWRLRA